MRNRTNAQELKSIEKETRDIKKSVEYAKRRLLDLSKRLEEFEIHSVKEEIHVPDIKVGDKVVAKNHPHKGKTGVVKSVGHYWVIIEADWKLVLKSGKIVSTYKKAKHNVARVIRDEP